MKYFYLHWPKPLKEMDWPKLKEKEKEIEKETEKKKGWLNLKGLMKVIEMGYSS